MSRQPVSPELVALTTTKSQEKRLKQITDPRNRRRRRQKGREGWMEQERLPRTFLLLKIFPSDTLTWIRQMDLVIAIIRIRERDSLIGCNKKKAALKTGRQEAGIAFPFPLPLFFHPSDSHSKNSQLAINLSADFHFRNQDSCPVSLTTT